MVDSHAGGRNVFATFTVFGDAFAKAPAKLTPPTVANLSC